MFGAIAGATTAYLSALAAMTPEARKGYLERQRLESSVEVRAARRLIEAEGLRGPYAEALLADARQMARDRYPDPTTLLHPSLPLE